MTKNLSHGIGLILLLVSIQANSTPMYSNSQVVTTATNTATFDGISGSLLGYTEDGIEVSVNDLAYSGGAYAGVHYGSGGNNSWVTISLASGGVIDALDFRIGDGYGGPFGSGHEMNLLWETFSGHTSTGFGDVYMDRGSYVGWTDVLGFTSIRVAGLDELTEFGNYQAIAIDDLRIESSVVPAPATLFLMGLGLVGLGLARRRKA